MNPGDPLMAAGLDSLASVEFTNMLEAVFKIKLPATLIFDYPSAASISDYIVTRLNAAAPAAAPPPAASAAAQAAHDASIERLVLSLAAGITGEASLGIDQPLMAAGLDSLGAVELRNSLQSSFAIEMPSTLVFDYPTVMSMAGYIASRLQPVVSSVDVAARIPPGALSSWSALAEGVAMTSLATRSPKVGSLTGHWAVMAVIRIRIWSLACCSLRASSALLYQRWTGRRWSLLSAGISRIRLAASDQPRQGRVRACAFPAFKYVTEPLTQSPICAFAGSPCSWMASTSLIRPPLGSLRTRWS